MQKRIARKAEIGNEIRYTYKTSDFTLLVAIASCGAMRPCCDIFMVVCDVGISGMSTNCNDAEYHGSTYLLLVRKGTCSEHYRKIVSC